MPLKYKNATYGCLSCSPIKTSWLAVKYEGRQSGLLLIACPMLWHPKMQNI
jgi:hypothetical protein